MHVIISDVYSKIQLEGVASGKTFQPIPVVLLRHDEDATALHQDGNGILKWVWISCIHQEMAHNSKNLFLSRFKK